MNKLLVSTAIVGTLMAVPAVAAVDNGAAHYEETATGGEGGQGAINSIFTQGSFAGEQLAREGGESGEGSEGGPGPGDDGPGDTGSSGSGGSDASADADEPSDPGEDGNAAGDSEIIDDTDESQLVLYKRGVDHDGDDNWSESSH